MKAGMVVVGARGVGEQIGAGGELGGLGLRVG